MPRNVKSMKLPAGAPGDWVAHAPGSPHRVYAVGPSLKGIEKLLAEKKLDIEDVEVYQVPSRNACTFVGGGELQVILGE